MASQKVSGGISLLSYVASIPIVEPGGNMDDDRMTKLGLAIVVAVGGIMMAVALIINALIG